MTGPRPFGPLERSTLSERVRDDIHRRIISGEIAPGARIPAERVLAEQFGVARTSVREAIQGLIALGVIEHRDNRSYVVERVPGAEMPPSDGRTKSLRTLLEARQVLELCLFELAASRATARVRNETLALALSPVPTTLDEFAIVDRQFHATVASACANPVLVEVYGRVLDALVNAGVSAELLLGIEPGEDSAEAIVRLAAEHRRIAEAFVASDVSLMLEEVDRHLGPVSGRRLNRPGTGRVPPRNQQAGATQRTVGM